MASLLRSTLKQRQVHITLIPTPRNLAQSRRVLKALQQFGDVATFWNLKYDFRSKAQNTGRCAFVIFDTVQGAKNALAASPIKIPIPESTNPPDDPLPITKNAEESQSVPSAPSITCTIQASDHDHHVTVRQNPYHRRFHLSKTWYEVQDLVRSKGERSVPLPQYADCFTRRKGTVPMRIQNIWTHEAEQSGATSLMKIWKQEASPPVREQAVANEDKRQENGVVSENQGSEK